jgi:hypothetical protein
MSATQVNHYRGMVKKVGRWAGTRWLRNQGVSLENAYLIVIGQEMPSHYPR